MRGAVPSRAGRYEHVGSGPSRAPHVP